MDSSVIKGPTDVFWIHYIECDLYIQNYKKWKRVFVKEFFFFITYNVSIFYKQQLDNTIINKKLSTYKTKIVKKKLFSYIYIIDDRANSRDDAQGWSTD